MGLKRSKYSDEPTRQTVEPLGPGQMSMSRQATRDAYESREIVDEEELKEEERRLRNKLELDKIQARQTRDDRQRLLDELQGSMKQMRP